jgi:hypothetical protein
MTQKSKQDPFVDLLDRDAHTPAPIAQMSGPVQISDAASPRIPDTE